MKLNLKPIDLKLRGEEIILNEKTANKLGINCGDRINVMAKGEKFTMLSCVSPTLIDEDEIGVLNKIFQRLELKEDEEVDVTPAKKPNSLKYIKKKINNQNLLKKDIKELIQDVVDGKLTDPEIASYVTALEINGMSIDEVQWLTEAMVETGEQLHFDEYPIMDKHSIGGVPGNKISLLIVPIVVAAGLKMPKTSSRAITGAAGTADIMEVLAEVEFSASEIYEITNEVGGVLAWGGATNIAPADDIFVKVEHPLSLDPRPQLLASVLSKKKAIGSDKVVIDIPTGGGTKVENREDASHLARDFIELGNRLDIDIECAITYGGTTIGHSIGPALEAKEALMALEGKKRAKKILDSGKALEKFKEILKAQKGDESISSEEISIGEYRKKLSSPSSGYITNLYTNKIIKIARTLGAPKDQKAGLKVMKKEGNEVKENETLIELFAEEEWKLKEAIKKAKKDFPMDIEGVLLKRIPEFKEI